LYSSQNTISVTGSSRMGWAGHVVHMEEEKFIQNSIGKPEGEKQF